MSCPLAFGLVRGRQMASQGTSLLDIAGEKIGAAALWGVLFYCSSMARICPAVTVTTAEL